MLSSACFFPLSTFVGVLETPVPTARHMRFLHQEGAWSCVLILTPSLPRYPRLPLASSADILAAAGGPLGQDMGSLGGCPSTWPRETSALLGSWCPVLPGCAARS